MITKLPYCLLSLICDIRDHRIFFIVLYVIYVLANFQKVDC